MKMKFCTIFKLKNLLTLWGQQVQANKQRD